VGTRFIWIVLGVLYWVKWRPRASVTSYRPLNRFFFLRFSWIFFKVVSKREFPENRRVTGWHALRRATNTMLRCFVRFSPDLNKTVHEFLLSCAFREIWYRQSKRGTNKFCLSCPPPPHPPPPPIWMNFRCGISVHNYVQYYQDAWVSVVVKALRC
jgi:hypothetical protein